MRVIICEDHALVRDGLERLLSTHGFEIAASVDTAEAFLAEVAREPPDVCVLDVRLPRRSPTRVSAPRSRPDAGIPVSRC